MISKILSYIVSFTSIIVVLTMLILSVFKDYRITIVTNNYNECIFEIILVSFLSCFVFYSFYNDFIKKNREVEKI